MSLPRAPRNTIDRERIIDRARGLLDEHGLEALTMRGLATSLGVRPMALYHHIATKDELLNVLVDSVFAEVSVPEGADEWRTELAHRSRSMREALMRHPWALPLMEALRNPGPASMRQHEAVLGLLRRSGFSLRAASHAYAVLDAFVYGFALQELMLSDTGLASDPQRVADGIDFSATPHMAELAQLYIDSETYPFVDSFDVGLDIVLDGLATIRERFSRDDRPRS